MLRITLLRLFIAAVAPAAAAGVKRDHLRIVLSAGASDGGSWSLVCPGRSRPGRVPVSRHDLAGTDHDATAPVTQPRAEAGVLIGYARCSTDKQDLTAQRQTLRQLKAPRRSTVRSPAPATSQSDRHLNSVARRAPDGDSVHARTPWKSVRWTIVS